MRGGPEGRPPSYAELVRHSSASLRSKSARGMAYQFGITRRAPLWATPHYLFYDAGRPLNRCQGGERRNSLTCTQEDAELYEGTAGWKGDFSAKRLRNPRW